MKPEQDIPTPLDILVEAESEQILEDAIKELDPRSQTVVQLRYYQGMTYRQIGQLIRGRRSGLPIEPERTRQIHNRALDDLRKKLEKTL
jgi:RNA polymerase sigma factor for flagellar operon FliA